MLAATSDINLDPIIQDGVVLLETIANMYKALSRHCQGTQGEHKAKRVQ